MRCGMSLTMPMIVEKGLYGSRQARREALAERVSIREVIARQRFVDDRHRRGLAGVTRCGEVAAHNQRDAHRAEVTRRDALPARDVRIVEIERAAFDGEGIGDCRAAQDWQGAET